MSEASQKRYLACISEQFPTVQSLYTEIIISIFYILRQSSSFLFHL